ncbi:MAG: RNA polymerase subunit sigma [Salinisphaeraceae bacterium]|jgi:RNA polymerase sigma-70 factor (ECF subfamily)|nr:RNA polymerase subunit sigma [Salinisphaeraceae bacterium]
MTERADADMNSKQHRFDAMVGAFSDDVYRYAYWLCRDRQIAEDVVQETLLRAWRFMDNLRDKKAVKSWLITTCRREHARLYERKRLDRVDMEVDDMIDLAGDSNWNAAELRELHQRIHALAEDYREPLALQVIMGYSVAEIAETMQISESAVMTRLFRARKQLLATVDADRLASDQVRGGRS